MRGQGTGSCVGLISVLLVLVACSSAIPTSQTQLKTFSTDSWFKGIHKPQCKAMLDSYCNFLYSPDVLGNLEVKRAESSTKILQGETPNQFTQVYYRYSLAKLRNRDFFPRDFARVLERHNYFGKLETFLQRQPRGEMALADRLSSEQTDYELGFIWNAAFNETVLVRMTRKYPSYYKLPDKAVPVEFQLERRRLRRELVSEVSRAIWRRSSEWKSVEQGFGRLQQSYVRVINKLDIPEEIRRDWIRRIQEVKLVLPGSFPAIASDECSTTRVNAYYYTYLNVVTICAGDFNSEDIIQTLAHEMGHALGIDRTQYLFQIRSDFGQRLASFRKHICTPRKFSCTAWAEYKDGFENSLASLDGYTPDLPEFQSCLKRRPTSKQLTDSDIERFARNIVSDRISELASSDRFLRITKPEIPMRTGKFQRNPNYLNPCSYFMWSQGEEPVDDELTTLIYFTAEYRCSQKPPSERLRDSIETAKAMTEQVLAKTIAIEGEYSARRLLEAEGFSSPPFERFADVIGSYAMAELLLESPDIWDRQNRFLASSSWQCLEPSLASHYPEESSIEKQYIFDAHAEGDQRRKEFFSRPIREAIQCEKDFEFNECRLPFQQAP
ncbi:MAG: hypothetical protein AB7G93_05265 [Bdellovibrionales bacterium]